MKYKLKEHVTDEMLVDVGYRLVFDKTIRAIKTIENRSVFVERDNHILTWRENDIQDLIELDYVEVVE